MSDSWIDPQAPDMQKLADSLVRLDRQDVVVAAVKKAESGEGVIIRLFKYADGPVSVNLDFKGKPVKQAFLADGLERAEAPLLLKDGKVQVPMNYALATILLKF
jgi:alpha-mannosidase